ncbi:hypothetical protein A3Q56_05078 [Intoshia linei]|uniref:Uncharacterized protein n=1 Tax=Intoshia linei TaxID=1819745 RepID=A0A177AYW5_9BILA|nr:hypothetical protein A3Q56_05078 [Intoshia linei]
MDLKELNSNQINDVIDNSNIAENEELEDFEELRKDGIYAIFNNLRNSAKQHCPKNLEDVFIGKQNDTVLRLRRIEKEGVFGFMGIQELNPIVFDNVQPSIIAFPTTWLVKAGFSAVVNIYSKKRLNKLIEIDYDSFCNKHQCQGSH